MFGCCSSSAKTYVLAALVACVMRSDAARGAVADLARAMYGASAFSDAVWSIVNLRNSFEKLGAVQKLPIRAIER